LSTFRIHSFSGDCWKITGIGQNQSKISVLKNIRDPGIECPNKNTFKLHTKVKVVFFESWLNLFDDLNVVVVGYADCYFKCPGFEYHWIENAVW
jgi:hypothetical protein